MPPSTIAVDKELALSFQPLLLAELTLVDATTMRLTTHPGVTYLTNTYLPRISPTGQNIQQIASLGPQGVDSPARIAVTLLDGDGTLFATAKTPGFAGALITFTLVFWDPGTANFSSDSEVKFTGVCDEITDVRDDGSMVLRARSKLDLSGIILPPARTQRRCPLFFPKTAAQRQLAADSPESRFFLCGYSPDATGGNAVGNLDGASPFLTCDFTRPNCIDRLGDSAATFPIIQDEAANPTGRYAGIQAEPPDIVSRGFKSAFELISAASAEEAGSLNNPIPIAFGKQWVTPFAGTVVGDANLTGEEAICAFRDCESIDRVIVKGTEIPREGFFNANIDSGFWFETNLGDRTGNVTANLGTGAAIWDRVTRPDPYGSMAVVAVVVPRALGESGSPLQMQVFGTWMKTRVYSDLVTWSDANASRNPVWQLLHLFAQVTARLDYSQIDVQSFLDASAVCDVSITAPDLMAGEGGPATYSTPRYSSSWSIKQPRPMADVINGLRRACDADLLFNAAGKLEIHIRQTLADQQGSAVAGSNYNTAVESKDASGSTQNGYVAYKFDESVVSVADDGKRNVSMRVKSLQTTPNRYHASFQNRRRQYQQDQVSLVSPDAVGAAGKEISRGQQLLGPETYDQHLRIFRRMLARDIEGNPSGTESGSWRWEIETTIRASHLRVGHIVLFDMAKFGLDVGLESPPATPINGVLCRVVEIKPSTNYERVALTLEWHEDDWYVDTFGQQDEPPERNPARDRLPRPPLPWQAHITQPDVADPIYDDSEWFFSLAQKYDLGKDATALARVEITGKQPVNNVSGAVTAPYVPMDGTAASGSGTILGDQDVYMALAALDTNGLQGPLSQVVKVSIPAGTLYTVSIPDIVWPAEADGYNVYAGTDPRLMAFQGTSATTPSQVDITALDERTFGPPDAEFDILRVKAKRVIHSGVVGVELTGVTSTTLTKASAGWTTNEWAGRIVSVIGFDGDQTPMPLANFSVTSNTADTLTITGPNPVTLGVGVGDVLIIRSRATSATASSYTDSLWVNAQAPSGLTVDAEIGRNVRIIAGTGRGQVRKIIDNTATVITIDGEWTVEPDGDSVLIVEEASWIYSVDSSPISNSKPENTTIVNIPIENDPGKPLMVTAIGVDGGDNESAEALAQFREIWVFGDAGSIASAVAPSDVTSVTAAEDPVTGADGTVMSQVTVSYNEPTPGGSETFEGVSVYGQDLDNALVDFSGNPTNDLRLLAEIPVDASPIARRLPPVPVTGLSMRLELRSYSAVVRNTTGPQIEVLIDGKQSGPTAPANPWCQDTPGGLTLSWEKNPEADLSHYNIAWTGNLQPYDVTVIPAHQTIVNVARNSDDGHRNSHDWVQRRYKGTIAGSVFTLDGTSPKEWIASQLLIETSASVFTGIDVTIFYQDGTFETIACSANTADTITLASAPAQTGVVEIRLGGEENDQQFYIQAVDTSDLRSTWATFPACSPQAPDGTTDRDPPLPPQITASSSSPSWWTVGFTGLSAFMGGDAARQRSGWLGVQIASYAATETETDANLAKMRSIRGVFVADVEVTYRQPGGGATDTQTFRREWNGGGPIYEADRADPSGDPGWREFATFLIDLPGVEITGVRARLENAIGLGDWRASIPGLFMGAGRGFTGDPAQRIKEVLASVPSAGQLRGEIQESSRINIVPTEDAVIQFPSVAPEVGERIVYVIRQGGTPYQITFAAGFTKLGNRRVPKAANSKTVVEFYATTVAVLECERFDTLWP